MVKKATCATEATTLETIPNIGTAIARDLRQMGLILPTDLIGKDPYAMYLSLCDLTGARQDPCVLDTFATYFAPADFNETVNTLGQALYAKQEPRKFERGTDLHTQSNPLPMCHRPGVLVKLTAT